MCDQPCRECRKCDEPIVCHCGLNTGDVIQAVCGHFVCDDCRIICDGCGEEIICPGCVLRDEQGNKLCGEECISK